MYGWPVEVHYKVPKSVSEDLGQHIVLREEYKSPSIFSEEILSKKQKMDPVIGIPSS